MGFFARFTGKAAPVAEQTPEQIREAQRALAGTAVALVDAAVLTITELTDSANESSDELRNREARLYAEAARIARVREEVDAQALDAEDVGIQLGRLLSDSQLSA